ncbi:MAG: hypothetical protein IKL07_04775 [Clostridium sp.]|nr:hypothetical protein [Clostridium sp.]
MESKLIMVEGLPGAGKTTVAKKVKSQMEEEGKSVILYEGMSANPADMAWQAYLTKEEYHRFVAECLDVWMSSKQTITDEELIRRIEVQSQTENGHVAIAYRNINFPEPQYQELIKWLETKEIFRNGLAFEQFRELNFERWSRFAHNMQLRKETAIFESSFLQNSILELMCYRGMNDEQILDYLMELADTIKFLNPRFLYVVTPDIESMVDAIAIERALPPESGKDWLTNFVNWVPTTIYGQRNKLYGKEGLLKVLRERQRMDYLVLEKIGIPVTWIVRQD